MRLDTSASEGNGIVQPWMSPEPQRDPQHTWKTDWKYMTLDEKIAAIEKEADENDITRPQGYTVSFHYNSKIEGHHFGRQHPMKPWRLTLTKQLVIGYGLQYAMDVYDSLPATTTEMQEFHSGDYLDFLKAVTPENMNDYDDEQRRYNFGDDCPVFDGMWDYCSIYTGATIDAARKLVSGQSDIAINWSGGLHHAKKRMASGFCYVNDIVIAIQELLPFHPRVLYIDIDVHHGDGVQEAFHSTDRVLTLSYHKYDKEEFFPGTGALDETGPVDLDQPGAHCSLNVPLKDGINDQQYQALFANTCGPVIETYNPTAIVLQCGADSLGGDRLGKFNLNIQAHGSCVEFVKAKCHDRKLLLVGGGGYTPRNVARTWCHETALCVGAKLNESLPPHIPYRQAFMGPLNGDGKLYPHWGEEKHKNEHDDEYLNNIVEKIAEQLKYIKGAPSVGMEYIPPGIPELREDLNKEWREMDDIKKEAAPMDFERKRRERNVGIRNEHRF